MTKTAGQGTGGRLRAAWAQMPRFYLFILLATAAKLVLMGLFSSDYQDLMFMPFTGVFVGGENPYEVYHSQQLLASFPYPPLMLFIMSAGRLLAGLVPGGGAAAVFFQSMLFKLPLLGFDFLGLIALMKLFPGRRRYIGLLYFASPIILYSTYLHGQLDIIPTALLMAALWALCRRGRGAQAASVALLAAAILTKHHILAVVPIIFIYNMNRFGLPSALGKLAAVAGLCVAGVLPFWGPGYLHTVLMNPEQGVLMLLQVSFGNVAVMVPLLGAVFVYLVFFLSGSVNRDLLLSFCGILFAVILICVPPMPGWYVWVVPFVTIFFLRHEQGKYKNLLVFVALNASYLIYFVFFAQTGFVDLYFLRQPLDWLKIDDAALAGVCFTLMEAFLICATVVMYRTGIASNSFYKRRDLPFVIGISGDSGSGKTTVLGYLAEALGAGRILNIEGDGDHRWARDEGAWEDVTHLDPKANYLYRQAMDVARLRGGLPVARADYDHGAGNFTEKRTLAPKKYIVVAGLHALYLPQMRKQLDLAVYMDTDEGLRRHWKLQRDCAARGHAPEEVLAELARRQADADKYIRPQREYADLVLRYYDPALPEAFDEGYTPVLSLAASLPVSYDTEPLVALLARHGLEIEQEFSGDLSTQVLRFKGLAAVAGPLPFGAIAEAVIPQLEDIPLEGLEDADVFRGVVKLLLVFLISKKMREET